MKPSSKRKGVLPDGPGGKPPAFKDLVASVIRAIPKGQTLSYAGVALRANLPGGARQVVRALRELKDVPWWRVIKSDGTVAREMVSKQAPRLRREGVEVVGRRVSREASSGGAARTRRVRGSR